jgi:N6-L-threonylcarbamoyladenine synthase
MYILGIESSCDDTAAAVITDKREILSSIVWSQLKQHQPYGGVVPEIAARAHGEVMDQVITEALRVANLPLTAIDLIAATGGPGLIGGVMVGLMTAKALAFATGKPFLSVNHLEGHALTVRLTNATEYPFLLLLISGGHCQWLAVTGLGDYHLLGATRDDALGEAFDKTAKMLGLPYPGGPQIEQLAKQGDAQRFPLPRPLTNVISCDFSFSGLKTAVLLTIQALQKQQASLTLQDKADICAAFQEAAKDCILNRLHHAIIQYEALLHAQGKREYPKQLVIAGGVAANQYLREQLTTACTARGYTLIFPPLALCTDNAAMIAYAGYEHFQRGETSGYDAEPRARWPL